MRYTIIIEKAEGNFSAYCPDVPGCASTGNTEKETLDRMKQVLKFHLEGLREINMEVPQHRAIVRQVEIRI